MFTINSQALKLAERTIQFADTLTVLTDGYIRAGRVLHAERSTAEAMNYYTKAKEGQPSNVLASIGLAQVQIESGMLLSPSLLNVRRHLKGILQPIYPPPFTPLILSCNHQTPTGLPKRLPC